MIPDFPFFAAPPTAELNPAQWTFERLVLQIRAFEESLDADHELALQCAASGQPLVIAVDDISYWGPDMITFTGRNPDGERVQLIQHITQLSVLLAAVPKRQKTARRIGFLLDRKLKRDRDEAEA